MILQTVTSLEREESIDIFYLNKEIRISCLSFLKFTSQTHFIILPIFIIKYINK